METVGSSLLHVSTLVLVTVLCTILSYGAYNLFFHPLRTYPGPKLWSAYRIPWLWNNLHGTLAFRYLELHKTYGPVVRVAPNELSYVDSRAWKDIYGFRNIATDGFSEISKDRFHYSTPVNGVYNILSASSKDHGRYRRLLSHGFSEKGMREMQPRIQSYTKLLLDGLRQRCDEGYLDILQWYNWTTFDMIGDLAFGESFRCLELQKTDPWIRMVFENVKSVPFINNMRRYGIDFLIPFITPKELLEARMTSFQNNSRKIDRRVEQGTGRGDFWDNVLEKSNKEDGKGMIKDEMIGNAGILVLGGSETTATLLSGTTYLLCTHPKVMQKLNEEVRCTFQREDEIDLLSVSKLSYMLAVLDEGMRFYPPVPDQGNRIVPSPGAMVCGKWVPGGTSLQAQQYASNHIETNFHRPNEFLPERWLGDPQFANDNRDAWQPFSIGPRNCIGKNLAYAEMRLILAKVCWNFDIELDKDRCATWIDDQKIFGLWEKEPLWVKLTPVQRS